MKRWMTAGDMNVAAFMQRMNLLHQDFSGLQQLLNREQEEITSREDRRRTVHWGPPTEAPFRQPRQSISTQDQASSASIEAQVTRESPRGQGWSTSAPSDSTSGWGITASARPTSGWGNSVSARARSVNALRSGPASASTNSPNPDRSRSPHQFRQSQSESPHDSGNNHDNHRKWQRQPNNTPPSDADFSDRGRNRDRRATDRNVASHDRANRSRSATPDDSRGPDRRHYPKPISNSPKQSSSSSHFPSRKPHVRTIHRDPKSQSVALPFKPPHQRYQDNHRSSVNEGSIPPFLTASPQLSSKRDRSFSPLPDHPSINKRHRQIPSSQLATPHAEQSVQTHQRSIPPRSSPFANPPVTHRASHHQPISLVSVHHPPPTANTGAIPRLVPMLPPPPVAPRPPTLPPSPSPPAATVTSPLSVLISTYRYAGSVQPAPPAGTPPPLTNELHSVTPTCTRLEEVERLGFALADPNNTDEVHQNLVEALSAVRKAPESSFLPPRHPMPPAAPAAAPTLNPLASIAPPPPPPSNALHPVGSPQPGSALASAIAAFGAAPPPPPSLPQHAIPVTAPLFDLRPPGPSRPAVILHAKMLPTSLRITPSRQHKAGVEKFTSIPGSKDMQPIISSESNAWAIHVKASGVRQDECAVFKIKHFDNDVTKAYRAAVGHYLTARANRSPEERGESCPICFGFHTFVGQACISPFIDWNAMLRKETHPICQTCHGIHHAGYACVNNPIGHSARTSGQHKQASNNAYSG